MACHTFDGDFVEIFNDCILLNFNFFLRGDVDDRHKYTRKKRKALNRIDLTIFDISIA